MSDRTGRRGLTRRQALLRAGGVTALALTGAGIADVLSGGRLPRILSFGVKPTGRVRVFHSRPDLRPPIVTTTGGGMSELRHRPDAGFLFLGPGPVSLKGSQQFGPLIVDRRGEAVWFRPVAEGLEVTNFGPARYRGEPVLVWWEGKVLPTGYGQGEAVLLDRTYREVARVRAAGRRSMDMHALTLTSKGTALFTCYPQTVPADLTSIGGRSDSPVLESIIQEVDIASGRLLFEWRSLDHVPVGNSQHPLREPYDYLHPNSIQELPDGNLLVSGRHTWALYKLERHTGKVIWTLGGKGSAFQMGPGAQFMWQHDARRLSDRVLTVFDNGADGRLETGRESRGLILEVDESRRRVGLRHAYPNPHEELVGAMGSVQILRSGRVLVGWGVNSQTSEFAADGTLLLDFDLPSGMYSYRVLWLPWNGTPHDRPALAAGRDPQGGTKLVYASWNGATGVTGWLVQAGSARDRLRPLGIARRRGFETAIPLHPNVRFASVTALDRTGRRLRRSSIVRL